MNGALQMLRAQLARGRCARSAVIASVRRCPMRRAAKHTHNTDTSARTQCTNTTAPRALPQSARPTAAPRGLPLATWGASGSTSEPVAATPARGASRTSCAQAVPRQLTRARAHDGHINTRATRQMARAHTCRAQPQSCKRMPG